MIRFMKNLPFVFSVLMLNLFFPSITAAQENDIVSRPVIIDTDMAADDWMAILYLLQRPDIEVIAITVTGAGEAHCAHGTTHALGLLALTEYESIPVACGRETPLEGDHRFPQPWRTDVDNLSGLSLPETEAEVSEQTAVELLTSLLTDSEERITLLTLGSLTNLAELLQLEPSLIDQIEMIYIMGGAVNVPGNLAPFVPENQFAEWNIYIDPVAANIVFDSGASITLVPLDATNNVPLTTGFYERLAANHTTPEAAFVYDALTVHYGFIQSGGYYFWDPLAAAILTDESLAEFETYEITVVEGGSSVGYTRRTAGGTSMRVAIDADQQRFEQIFLETLNRT